MPTSMGRKRERGALPEAAAAPATVSGELHSISHWSLRMLREGGGKAATREPGDLSTMPTVTTPSGGRRMGDDMTLRLLCRTALVAALSLFTTSLFTTSLFTTSLFTTSLFTTSLFTTSLFTTSLFTTSAFAHHVMGGKTPSTFVEGLLSGTGHPVIGPDHLAFLLAIGIAVGV